MQLVDNLKVTVTDSTSEESTMKLYLEYSDVYPFRKEISSLIDNGGFPKSSRLGIVLLRMVTVEPHVFFDDALIEVHSTANNIIDILVELNDIINRYSRSVIITFRHYANAPLYLHLPNIKPVLLIQNVENVNDKLMDVMVVSHTNKLEYTHILTDLKHAQPKTDSNSFYMSNVYRYDDTVYDMLTLVCENGGVFSGKLITFNEQNNDITDVFREVMEPV